MQTFNIHPRFIPAIVDSDLTGLSETDLVALGVFTVTLPDGAVMRAPDPANTSLDLCAVSMVPVVCTRLHVALPGTLGAFNLREQYSWPGGYQLMAATADGAIICHACASEFPDERCTVTPHWEGPDEHCEHCDGPIPSVYGDPDG